MDVHLSEDLERLVLRKVESGLYRSADEVVSTALRALDAQDQELDARATTFQAEVERRLSEGPAAVMDFTALKRSLREQVGATKAERG
jgi:antitoxin ParD1/3/4